jgi:putative transposase
MPKTARIAPNEYVYHLLTRGNNRQDVFKDKKDFDKYREILQRYKEKYKFELYHYVLMTNHVHLVLETTENGGKLSEIMKGINLSHAQYYKKSIFLLEPISKSKKYCKPIMCHSGLSGHTTRRESFFVFRRIPDSRKLSGVRE